MKRSIALILAIVAIALGACKSPTPTEPTIPNTLAPSLPESTASPIASTPVESTTAPGTEPPEPPKPVLEYQAHRGVSTDYPENTIPAFQASIDLGFKIIELDPIFTKDNQCVILHDASINRTCRTKDGAEISETIAVSSITYEELLAYDAGIHKGQRFKGTKVPLLSEVAELVKGTGVALKLDNKIQNYTDEQLEIIFQIVENSGADIGFTCKTLDFVKRVKARLPDATIHYDGIVSVTNLKVIKKAAGDSELYIWQGVASATETLCNKIKEYGKLGIWTVKNKDELKKAKSLGADIIETNGEVKPPKENRNK